MLSFLAVKVPHPEARQIIAYMQIVIDLARKHPGPGWLSYDALFRQQMNAGGSSRWNELNTSLMAATVLSTRGGENGKLCQNCMATDHVQANCSLLSLDSNLANARQVSGPTRNQPRRPFQSAPYPSQRAPAGEPCRRFNWGICFIRPCKYEHTCNACFRGNHPAIECRSRPEDRAFQQQAQPMEQQPNRSLASREPQRGSAQ